MSCSPNHTPEDTATTTKAFDISHLYLAQRTVNIITDQRKNLHFLTDQSVDPRARPEAESGRLRFPNIACVSLNVIHLTLHVCPVFQTLNRALFETH